MKTGLGTGGPNCLKISSEIKFSLYLLYSKEIIKALGLIFLFQKYF
jgi:hypothetical protein